VSDPELDHAPEPPHRHGVLIEIAEQIIAEIGEDTAWRIARQSADRKAARYAIGTLHRTEERDYRQNFPRTDPDTGIELPPMRAYRFTYTDDGDA
jgi:hypothetical protein